MENTENKNMVNRSGKVWAGFIIMGIGGLLLLRNFGFGLPHWFFSWSVWLVVIGLFVGARHNFRSSGWFVMVLVGSYFTLDDIFDDLEMPHIALPIAIVALGLYLIAKPKDASNCRDKRRRRKERFDKFEYVNPVGQQQEPEPVEPIGGDKKDKYNNDYINSVNVFGGSNQVIYSKNLKGGEVVAVFGGGDLNLTQSDFEGQIILDVTAIFGGVKIVVPATWQIKSEVTAIFGGVDDKRAIYPATEQANKLIIIRGVVLFGGVEFKSY